MSLAKNKLLERDSGFHNAHLEEAQKRLVSSHSYKDLSTVILCPTRGGRCLIPKVVSSWVGLMRPMNQQCLGPLFLESMEVGDAYNKGIEMILNNPQLSQFKYVLTMEDDVIPPPDGLLKLYESMDNFDVVGALYWTKGEDGMPMIYGSPSNPSFNFAPQLPIPETLQPANGLGMGFNLFKLNIFKDPKLEKPWFKTVQEYIEGVGSRGYTQDLFFYEKAGKLGYKFACNTKVKCGHMDVSTGIVW